MNIEISFPNGYHVQICGNSNGIKLYLINQSGYIISDKKISEDELDVLKNIIKEA